jgi:hypothetical protein
MSEVERLLGGIETSIKNIEKSLEPLPGVCTAVAVHQEKILQLENRANAASARNWQLMLAAIGASLSGLFSLIVTFFKGGK